LAPSQATDRDEEVDAVNTDGSKYMDTGRPCGAREEAAELSARARGKEVGDARDQDGNTDAHA